MYSLICIVLANLFLVVLSNLVCVVLAGLVLVVLKSTLRLPADNNEFVYPNPETLGSKQNLRQQKQFRPPRQDGLQDVQYLIITICETSFSVDTFFLIFLIFLIFLKTVDAQKCCDTNKSWRPFSSDYLKF